MRTAPVSVRSGTFTWPTVTHPFGPPRFAHRTAMDPAAGAVPAAKPTTHAAKLAVTQRPRALRFATWFIACAALPNGIASFTFWRHVAFAPQPWMVPVVVVSRPGALMNARFSPAAKRFGHFRVRERTGLIIPGMKAPAWAYLKGPLHGHSSTAIRAQRKLTTGNPA